MVLMIARLHGICRQRPLRVLLLVVLGMTITCATAGTFSVPLAATAGERMAVSMVFADANPSPEVLRFLEFTGNFVRPDAPAPKNQGAMPALPLQWRVVYRDIYPGIDLVSYRDQGRVQYDIIAYPQANFSRVRIIYQGLENMDLRGRFPGYQIINGVRVAVPVDICRNNDASYFLKPAPYDPNVQLIIPTTQTPLTAVSITVAAR